MLKEIVISRRGAWFEVWFSDERKNDMLNIDPTAIGVMITSQTLERIKNEKQMELMITLDSLYQAGESF